MPSRIEIRNVASKTSALPVTWAGLPIAAFARRPVDPDRRQLARRSRVALSGRVAVRRSPSIWKATDLTDGNWVSV